MIFSNIRGSLAHFGETYENSVFSLKSQFQVSKNMNKISEFDLLSLVAYFIILKYHVVKNDFFKTYAQYVKRNHEAFAERAYNRISGYIFLQILD